MSMERGGKHLYTKPPFATPLGTIVYTLTYYSTLSTLVDIVDRGNSRLIGKL